MSANWIPEIMYEESEGESSSAIPFIMVPQSEEMPKILFIFESRQTEEMEPGLDGNPVPIVEWDLHQYADMKFLKEGLDEELFDKVRVCLGLEPLRTAAAKGKQLTQKIKSNLEEREN